MSASISPRLRREVGLGGAVFLGLGSIVGTGVFVSIGVAAEIAGPAVILATLLAAFVAACNGLSSAQLAASLPVSGGTYEYGHVYLRPAFGFAAGWMFVCAKSASAAAAALGFGGYLLHLAGGEGGGGISLAGAIALALLTAVVLLGMRRSNVVNLAIVGVTLAALAAFLAAGAPSALGAWRANTTPFFAGSGGGAIRSLLHGTALMFVAYTGYGRIATLGEEVRDPERTIPRAMIVTLLVSMALYLGVALVGVGAVGAGAFGSSARTAVAPLEVTAERFGVPFVPGLLAVGAMTAMLGVLLNLILGLSRMVYAMGLRGDLPRAFGRVSKDGRSPWAATLAASAVIGLFVAHGDIRATWSFSAFTVLVYYAVTNASALRLPPEKRLYPRWLAWSGLASCLFLAFWVEPRVWGLGLLLLGAGFALRALFRRRSVIQ